MCGCECVWTCACQAWLHLELAVHIITRMPYRVSMCFAYGSGYTYSSGIIISTRWKYKMSLRHIIFPKLCRTFISYVIDLKMSISSMGQAMACDVVPLWAHAQNWGQAMSLLWFPQLLESWFQSEVDLFDLTHTFPRIAQIFDHCSVTQRFAILVFLGISFFANVRKTLHVYSCICKTVHV